MVKTLHVDLRGAPLFRLCRHWVSCSVGEATGRCLGQSEKHHSEEREEWLNCRIRFQTIQRWQRWRSSSWALVVAFTSLSNPGYYTALGKSCLILQKPASGLPTPTARRAFPMTANAVLSGQHTNESHTGKQPVICSLEIPSENGESLANKVVKTPNIIIHYSHLT